MKEFDYIKESGFTMSDKWFGDNVPKHELVCYLHQSVNALKNLDRLKKQLFYGKDIPNKKFSNNLTKVFDTELSQLFLHGILGIATEAGELLELLLKTIENEFSEIDKVNLIEEIGDLQWYEALLARIFNFVFEDCQIANISKLRKRYPNKFTTNDAINRNLNNERKDLENNLDK